jgi:hypothetical protein
MLIPIVLALAQKTVSSSLLFQCGPEASGRFFEGLSAAGDQDGDDVIDIVASTFHPPLLIVFSGRDGHRLHLWSGADERDYGGSVGDAGDWNGDGRDDFWLIVHEHGVGTDHLRIVSGADGKLLRAFDAPRPGGRLACSAVGDVNGDGKPDLLLGMTHSDTKDAGCARLVSGADGSVIREWRGDHPGDLFGAAVCVVGDIDGDGCADFAIGAPNRGIVRLVSGRDGSTLHTLDDLQDSADHQRSEVRDFGSHIAAGADVDGDGVPDIAVAEHVLDGTVLVFSGKTGKQLRRLSTGLDLIGPNESHGAYVGWSIVFAPDLDGDGCAEILVGDSGYSPSALDQGAVVAYSGKTGKMLALVCCTGSAVCDFGKELCLLGKLGPGPGVTFAASCANGASVLKLMPSETPPK